MMYRIVSINADGSEQWWASFALNYMAADFREQLQATFPNQTFHIFQENNRDYP